MPIPLSKCIASWALLACERHAGAMRAPAGHDNARSQHGDVASGVRSVYRAQEGRRRPIVPQGCPCSIVGAGGLNDRVRDGNGCVPSARVTSPPARTDAGQNLTRCNEWKRTNRDGSKAQREVETRGFEPLTLWLQTRCSAN